MHLPSIKFHKCMIKRVGGHISGYRADTKTVEKVLSSSDWDNVHQTAVYAVLSHGHHEAGVIPEFIPANHILSFKIFIQDKDVI